MKKSEFKALLRETLMEILPDVIRIVNESNMSNNHRNNLSESPGISAIHTSPRKLVGKSGYETLPENPKEIINGEKFVSGKGILEWRAKQAGMNLPQTEFNHSEKDVENLLGRLGLMENK